MLRLYTYHSCDSCRKARKWLEADGIDFEEIAIRENPPTMAELRTMRASRDSLKAMFSSSGADYRSLGLAAKIGGMDDEKAFQLMSENGNLVKRPFLIGGNIALQGFRLRDWEKAFS